MGQTTVVQKRFVVARLDQMPRKKLQWLWPERIALGALTVLAGDFEQGKSLLALDLAARVSKGAAWPDGRPGLGASEVMLLVHEDNLQCMSNEALEAAGADMKQIVAPWETEELGNRGQVTGDRLQESKKRDEGEELEVVKRRPINLKKDLDVLELELARMENCRLVIIDSIDAHLPGANSVEARMWLRSLSVIAMKYQVAMVLVTRMKEGRKSPLCRLAGGMGLAFRLVVDEGQSMPRVEWSTEAVTATVEEVMEELRRKAAKPSPAVSRAMEYLQEALADGPRLTREIEVEAKERGISRSSLERARKEMQVRAFRKEIPGASWICLKEDETWKKEPTRAVDNVDGVDGVEGVEGLGNGAGERTTESTEGTEKGGDEERVDGVDGVEGLGNCAGEENAENAEGAEKIGVGWTMNHRGEHDGDCESENVEDVEGVEDLGDADGLENGEDSKDCEEIEACFVAVEELTKEPEEFCAFWAKVVEGLAGAEGLGLDRFGKLTTDRSDPGAGGSDVQQAKEEMLAVIQCLANDPEGFAVFWETVAEVLEDLGRLGDLEGGRNGRRIDAERQRRKKREQKMRQMKKKRRRQRKLQRAR